MCLWPCFTARVRTCLQLLFRLGLLERIWEDSCGIDLPSTAELRCVGLQRCVAMASHECNNTVKPAGRGSKSSVSRTVLGDFGKNVAAFPLKLPRKLKSDFPDSPESFQSLEEQGLKQNLRPWWERHGKGRGFLFPGGRCGDVNL